MSTLNPIKNDDIKSINDVFYKNDPATSAKRITDSKGNVFVVNSENSTITKVFPDGTSTIFCDLSMYKINSIAIDAYDNLYASDHVNNSIIKILPDGTSSVLCNNDDLTTRGFYISKDGQLCVDRHTDSTEKK